MIRLVIFDMDGTLLDSERFYGTCFIEACKRYGITFGWSDYKNIIGKSYMDTEKYLMNRAATNVTYSDVMDMAMRIERERLGSGEKIEIKKGYEELKKYLSDKNIVMAIATSTYKEIAESRLKHAGILNDFACIVYGNEVKKPKPDPEIYLSVLEKMNISKNEAIVIEDSDIGISASYDAGIPTYWIEDLDRGTEETYHKIVKKLHDLENVIQVLEGINK